MNNIVRGSIEPFYTIKEASRLLNVPHWLLLRAAKRRLIPVHTIGNSRKRVLISEAMAAILGGLS